MSSIRSRPTRHPSLTPFDPRPFAASPLYSALATAAAADPALLELAGHTRAGQQQEFALFGAVQYLLLGGVEHELAAFYPSVVGADGARSASTAGPAFADFCAAHRERIVELISSRLVQTNHVRRAVGLRTALAAIAAHVAGPVDLIEVGCSAGLLLRFDRYGYRLPHAKGGEVRYGDAGSPVQLTSERRGPVPLPDLDVLPPVASVTGVDLAPVDPTDADSRAWLEALVWPEDEVQRELLSAALQLTAADPPSLLAGDAVDVLPDLAPRLTAGGDRVVFHCATRMHVPADRLDAFDDAVDSLGTDGRLWRVAIETQPDPDPRPAGAQPGAALQIDDPDGRSHLVAVVDGHLRWIEPLPDTLGA